jgi:hypothetical protein
MCGKNKISLKSIPLATVVEHRQAFLTDRVTQISKLVNDFLDRPNPQPIGIGYCPKILKDRDYMGILPDREYEPGCNKMLHDSIIVGRRKGPTGQCQFLVRETQGSECKKENEWKWDCEKGQLWVDADALTRNVAQTF